MFSELINEHCVEKLDMKCNCGVTGQSTTSTSWKFDAVSRRNSTALASITHSTVKPQNGATASKNV